MGQDASTDYRQRLIYVLCALGTFVSIASIFDKAGFLHVLNNYRAYVGMIFPLLFAIKNKNWRNPLITISMAALILGGGWISLVCVAMTFVFMFWNTRKLWVIVGLSVVLAVAPAVKSRSFGTLFKDLEGRIGMYSRTMELWNHHAFGEGLNSFQKIPENLPANRPDKLWMKWTHSDYLQGLYEFGIVRMVFVIFFALIPFGFARLDGLTDQVIFISYLSVLLNACFDFPFHRPISAIVGAAISFLQFTNLRTR